MKSVDRGVHIDLSESAVVAFMRSADQWYRQPIDSGYVASKKMLDKGTRAVPTTFSNVGVKAYLLRKNNYELFKYVKDSVGKPQKVYVSKVSSITILTFSLTVRYHANLLVKQALDQAKSDLIANAFTSYNPTTDGAIEEFITANAANNGINESDFELLFLYELVKDGKPAENTDQDDQLKKLYQGREEYHLMLMGHEWLDDVPTPPKDNVIVIDPGGDGTGPINEIVKREQEHLAGQGCAVTKTFTKNIATLPIPTWIEFKTETECHWEENDCFKTRVCLDVPYSRETYTTLFATMIYSVDQDGILNILEHCVVESALASAVIGLVTENFPAAIIAFKALTLACIKEHALKEFPCMVPDLFLVSEARDWHRVI